jgi:cell division protein FtsQ
MPRLSATPADAALPPRRGTKLGPKKKTAPPDRLSAQKLFWRRVKRSFWPGFWFVVVVCVLVLGHAVYKSVATMGPLPSPVAWARNGMAQLGATAGLRITDVQVHGVPATEVPDALAVIGVKKGDPSYGVSLRAIQAKLEAWGPVQTATVQRILPGTLAVSIIERNALAIWQTEGANGAPAFVVIDQKGAVVAGEDAGEEKRREPGLLLLSGADAPANAGILIPELKAEPAVLARVVAAARVDGLRWNLILKDQTVVKLPVDGEADAIAQLNTLQTNLALLDRPVEVIDLRLPGKLIVRPYPDANAHPAAGSTGK